MDTPRFVRNLVQILRGLHKNLLAEANTETGKAVARLLRSKRGRTRISCQIADLVLQEQDKGCESDREHVRRMVPQESRDVEAWLAQTAEDSVNYQGNTRVFEHTPMMTLLPPPPMTALRTTRSSLISPSWRNCFEGPHRSKSF